MRKTPVFSILFGRSNPSIIYSVFVLFFIYLLCYLLFSILQGNVIGRDASRYVELADSAQKDYFLQVKNKDELAPPLLVMMMIHSYHFFGIPSLKSGLVINLICGAMCSVFVFTGCWILSRNYFLSVLSSLFYFLIPGIRDISIDILRDAPSLCLNLLAINLFILFLKKRSIKHIWLCGCVIAISLGFRLENLEFFLIFIVLCIYYSICSKADLTYSIKSIGRNIVVLCSGFFIGLIIFFFLCFRSDFFTIDMMSMVYQNYISMLL